MMYVDKPDLSLDEFRKWRHSAKMRADGEMCACKIKYYYGMGGW